MDKKFISEMQGQLIAAAEVISPELDLTFKPMFGGACAYGQGRVFAILWHSGIALKLSPEAQTELLRQKGAIRLQFAESYPPSKQYIVVPPKILKNDEALAPWVEKSIAFARTLPPSKPKRKKRPSGFTLVEILIVLMVLVLLTALLLPIFANSRENARRTTCGNNLKQLYVAMQQYVQDSDAHYPTLSNWEFAVEPYLKSRQVFVCPSQYTHSTPSDYYFNAERFNLRDGIKRSGAGEAMVASPTYSILLEDWGDTENGAPYRELHFPTSCGITLFGGKDVIKGFSTIHSEGGNYVFADGHVKWLLPEMARDAECKAGELQPGFK